MKVTPFAIAAALVAGLPAIASAQSRTPWQLHRGEGNVSFSFPAPHHGAPIEYARARIPAASDPGWSDAPDVDVIGFSEVSSLCGALSCLYGANFTYFQTFVDVPAGAPPSTFTIEFGGIDDGVRTTIFNSRYPDGVVVDGSYVYLGTAGTANLASLVVPGEINRVVVTHVDDCCSGSSLWSAYVVLNGSLVGTCGGEGDRDQDSVCDDVDNCLGMPNEEQSDRDGDGVGDACDPVCVVVQRGTFGEVRDTYVTAQAQVYPTGAYPYLYTGTHSSGDKVALLYFNLGFIPPWSIVTSARLTLSQSWSAVASSVVRVHQAAGPWSEATATYANFPGYEPAVEGSFATIGFGAGLVSVDVSGAVQAWVDQLSPNYGLMLEEDFTAGRGYFRASEHSSVTSRPKLEVCYIPTGY